MSEFDNSRRLTPITLTDVGKACEKAVCAVGDATSSWDDLEMQAALRHLMAAAEEVLRRVQADNLKWSIRNGEKIIKAQKDRINVAKKRLQELGFIT